MLSYYNFHKFVFEYILIPVFQGISYIKKFLCPSEEVIHSMNDSDEFEVIEGKLIGKDGSFSQSISNKHLEDIRKGMNVVKLTKILCYLEDISFDSVERVSIDYIYKGEYVSNDYKIELGSGDII